MSGELTDGNMNAVRRVGDTVHRRAGAWTPFVHRYLDHLRAAGVDWVPRPLGIDGADEVLSYLEGTVPVYPLPSWVWSESVLADGARRLRALHDASAGFVTEGATWQLAAHEPAEVMCHNDFAPHNLVFDEHGAIVGAIDFDMCSPGPRLWDLAYFATRAVPLGDPAAESGIPLTEQRRRIEVALAAYRSASSPFELVRVAIVRLRDLAEFSERMADELGKPELSGHALGYRRDADYLEANLA